MRSDQTKLKQSGIRSNELRNAGGANGSTPRQDEPANDDALHLSSLRAEEVGLTPSVRQALHIPSEPRLTAYLGGGLPIEKGRGCGSIFELSEYLQTSIEAALLQQMGKVDYLEKVGADGLMEAVTVTDKACSQLIINAVTPIFPESWTEEHLPADPRRRRHHHPFAMVDPIDGTEEFKRGLAGGFGNIVGLLEFRNGKHTPVGGIISIPRPVEQRFRYHAPDGSTQNRAGTEHWRTRGPDGGISYFVNKVETPLPRIRSQEEIIESGQLRVHVRGVCAYKYNSELAAGLHPGGRPMGPIEWTIGSEESFKGLQNIDVQHYQEVVEYAHRLAEILGVTPVFVAAGGSACGFNELLTGRVDVVLNLPGERSKEWDISVAVPLLESRSCGDLPGHISQCNGESLDTRGFNCEDLTLRNGYVASINLPREILFNRTVGLVDLNERSKRSLAR